MERATRAFAAQAPAPTPRHVSSLDKRDSTIGPNVSKPPFSVPGIVNFSFCPLPTDIASGDEPSYTSSAVNPTAKRFGHQKEVRYLQPDTAQYLLESNTQADRPPATVPAVSTDLETCLPQEHHIVPLQLEVSTVREQMLSPKLKIGPQASKRSHDDAANVVQASPNGSTSKRKRTSGSFSGIVCQPLASNDNSFSNPFFDVQSLSNGEPGHDGQVSSLDVGGAVSSATTFPDEQDYDRPEPQHDRRAIDIPVPPPVSGAKHAVELAAIGEQRVSCPDTDDQSSLTSHISQLLTNVIEQREKQLQAAFDDQNSSLQDQLALMSSERAVLDGQKKQLTQDNVALTAEVNLQKQRLDSLKAKAAKFSKFANGLGVDLSSLKKESDSYRRQCEALTQELATLKASQEQLRRNSASCSVRSASATSDALATGKQFKLLLEQAETRIKHLDKVLSQTSSVQLQYDDIRELLLPIRDELAIMSSNSAVVNIAKNVAIQSETFNTKFEKITEILQSLLERVPNLISLQEWRDGTQVLRSDEHSQRQITDLIEQKFNLIDQRQVLHRCVIMEQDADNCRLKNCARASDMTSIQHDVLVELLKSHAGTISDNVVGALKEHGQSGDCRSANLSVASSAQSTIDPFTSLSPTHAISSGSSTIEIQAEIEKAIKATKAECYRQAKALAVEDRLKHANEIKKLTNERDALQQHYEKLQQDHDAAEHQTLESIERNDSRPRDLNEQLKEVQAQLAQQQELLQASERESATIREKESAQSAVTIQNLNTQLKDKTIECQSVLHDNEKLKHHISSLEEAADRSICNNVEHQDWNETVAQVERMTEDVKRLSGENAQLTTAINEQRLRADLDSTSHEASDQPKKKWSWWSFGRARSDPIVSTQESVILAPQPRVLEENRDMLLVPPSSRDSNTAHGDQLLVLRSPEESSVESRHTAPTQHTNEREVIPCTQPIPRRAVAPAGSHVINSSQVRDLAVLVSQLTPANVDLSPKSQSSVQSELVRSRPSTVSSNNGRPQANTGMKIALSDAVLREVRLIPPDAESIAATEHAAEISCDMARARSAAVDRSETCETATRTRTTLTYSRANQADPRLRGRNPRALANGVSNNREHTQTPRSGLGSSQQVSKSHSQTPRLHSGGGSLAGRPPQSIHDLPKINPSPRRSARNHTQVRSSGRRFTNRGDT